MLPLALYLAYILFFAFFAKVKINGQEVTGLLRLFVAAGIGPIVFMIMGTFMWLIGVVFASPLSLFLSGKWILGLIIYLLFSMLAAFDIVKIDGKGIPNVFFRIVIGPITIVAIGLIFRLLGPILAMPVWAFLTNLVS